MNKLIRAALSALLFAVGLTLPTFAVAETQPLTPDGNLEIVDDIVHEDKQFITVKSRSGAEFYIVIDRSRESDNVYFLNQVDDVDLFALLEDDSSANCSCKEKCTVGAVNSDCFVCRMDVKSCKGKVSEVKSETISDSEPAETEKKPDILPVILIVGVIGGGAVIGFLKLRKNKPKSAPVSDFDDTDDEDFAEDETEVEDGNE